jgi:mannose-6-phosphate isomerase-like protein (cupin superfamily)
MAVTTQPYALAREEGEELWFLGAPTRVIANAEQTGGAFGLIEQVIPAGSESPLHVHHAEDESFYVVEGRITFLCGDQKVHAEAGPSSTVHVGSRTAFGSRASSRPGCCCSALREGSSTSSWR